MSLNYTNSWDGLPKYIALSWDAILGRRRILHCRQFFCALKSFLFASVIIENDIKLNLVYRTGKIYWYASAECTIYFICLEFCLKLFVLLLRIEKRYILYKIELGYFLLSLLFNGQWRKLTHSKLTHKYPFCPLAVHSQSPSPGPIPDPIMWWQSLNTVSSVHPVHYRKPGRQYPHVL